MSVVTITQPVYLQYYFLMQRNAFSKNHQYSIIQLHTNSVDIIKVQENANFIGDCFGRATNHYYNLKIISIPHPQHGQVMHLLFYYHLNALLCSIFQIYHARTSLK